MCDKKQKEKVIPEAAMFSTPEGFTYKRSTSPMTPAPVKKPSARMPLCCFTNVLNVKKKTYILQVGDVK